MEDQKELSYGETVPDAEVDAIEDVDERELAKVGKKSVLRASLTF
jgi:hypothetical protein